MTVKCAAAAKSIMRRILKIGLISDRMSASFIFFQLIDSIGLFGKSGFPDDFTFKIKNDNSLVVTIGRDHKFPESRVPEGRWVHVAATVGDRVATVYTDGIPDPVLVHCKTMTSEFPLFIGFDRKKDDPPRHFRGLLDELRIYNRVLTPEEIKLLATPPGAK